MEGSIVCTELYKDYYSVHQIVSTPWMYERYPEVTLNGFIQHYTAKKEYIIPGINILLQIRNTNDDNPEQ